MKKRKNARKRKTTATRKVASKNLFIEATALPVEQTETQSVPVQKMDAYEVAAQKVEQVLTDISSQDRYSFGECNVNVLEDQIKLAREHLQRLVAIKRKVKPSLLRRIIKYFDLRR